MSIEPNDWRLFGQEKYLKNQVLSYKKYSDRRTATDHDHCQFCGAKFSDTIDDALKAGYTTSNDYWWICAQCFEDFKKIFGWKVVDQSK